ncbi:17586_t:CDS:2 [Entrophospora sp. SA101]|nr:17586_t:CDS:2 [Entrophospora sp. SA101]
MHKTDSGFYVIDVLPLHHASKRPFHLERRMKSKKSNSSHVHCHDRNHNNNINNNKLFHYSTEEAQLKKAALLEQRRLKLARQFLHVKNVLVKQHQRALHDSSAKRSHIQETLKMAEKNRNTILQRLVEQCAQEVARCKEVARQQQLKNQEEIDRRRADMERRQRATAARRARLLTVPKSRLLSSDDTSPPTREEAASIIQNAWRYHKLIRIIETYRSFDISLHTTENMTFHNTVQLLQKPAVIQTTSKFLQRVTKVSRMTMGTGKYKNPAKVFLSAYMIVSHTKEILIDIGYYERTLLKSTKVMVNSLEKWLNSFSNDKHNKIHYNGLLNFLSAWDTYYKDFNLWKSKDSEKLANNLIAHYMELEKLWNTVKNQANAETEWKNNIIYQQEEIRRKIKNLGGDEATAKLERTLKRLKENSQSGASNNSDTDTSDSVNGMTTDQESDEQDDDDNKLGAPPRQPFVPPNLQAKVSKKSFSSGTKSSYEIPTDAGGLTNEQLIHEIIIDPEFELKPSKLSGLEERVHKMAKKAYFDSIKEDFEKGKFDRCMPNLLNDIKQRLVELMPPNSPMYSSVNEVLDIELITQQSKAGVYNIRNCIMFITNMMLQICAPVRDEQIQSLQNMTELSEIFQRLLEILDLMRLDLANYRLKAHRPYLKEHAVDYERRKFEQALESNRLSLERTKIWLQPTIDSLLRTVAERNPENVLLPNQRNHGIKFAQVYDEALVSYIFQQALIEKNNCPETFLLDTERLWGFQNEGQAITIVAVLLMLTKNIAIGSSANSISEGELETLKNNLFVLLMDRDIKMDNLTTEILSHFPSNISSETQSLVKSMVSKTLSQSDKVFSLLSRRIQSIIKQHLQTGQFPKKETLSQYGVLPVAKELEQLSRKIFILALYNREVYANWYDKVIRERLDKPCYFFGGDEKAIQKKKKIIMINKIFPNE